MHTVTSEFCRFDRRVLVARAGDTLEFVNAGTVAIAPQLVLGDLNDIRTLPREGKPVVVKNLPAGVGSFHDAVHQGWKDDALQGFPAAAALSEDGKSFKAAGEQAPTETYFSLVCRFNLTFP